MASPNKSLGQHWLRDKDVLASIADSADITSQDTVLEIGPGLGTLTSELLRRSGKVIAVEFDAELARKLPGQFPGTSLTVVSQDILTFDLGTLPKDYKVVANVPYYITSKIIQRLMTSDNQPATAALLVQKEVAQRLAAEPGDMSILAVSAQIYATVSLGDIVPAEYFTPPPKVDSQVVILHRRPEPLVGDSGEKDFFRVVKAGFSARRKKLRSSLSGGLALPKDHIEEMLSLAQISPDQRAEDLDIKQWIRLAEVWHDFSSSAQAISH